MQDKVLIAGIAGASLGTEIAKCLDLVKNYEIYGCDISSFAYGHYSSLFQCTFLVNINDYVQSVLKICLENNIKYIIPGGEQPNILLSKYHYLFAEYNIKIVSNNHEVVSVCSSKKKLFEFLNNNSIVIPKTLNIDEGLISSNFPCIIKPSEGSGGSNFVYIAKNERELKSYMELFSKNKIIPVVQEYISPSEGEYTVGVLSSTLGNILGSIALKRTFDSKLSVAFKSDDLLISSGYSQGLVDDFPSIIETCEQIAAKLGSTGPINIQGRMKDNQFIPFEINPRFSASTYIRALAGLNEIDFYLRHLIRGENNFSYKLKYGYYLRGFQEKYVSKEAVIK